MIGLLVFGIFSVLAAVSLFLVIKAVRTRSKSKRIAFLLLALLPFSELLLNQAIWQFLKIRHAVVTEEQVADMILKQGMSLKHQLLDATLVWHELECLGPGAEGCRNAFSAVLIHGNVQSLSAAMTRFGTFQKSVSDALRLYDTQNYVKIERGDRCGSAATECFHDREFDLSFLRGSRTFRDRLSGVTPKCERGQVLFYKYIYCDRVRFAEGNRGFIDYDRRIGLDIAATFGFLNDLDGLEMHRPTRIVWLDWVAGNAIGLDYERVDALLRKGGT